jgi:hypothetical protein
MIHEDDRGTFFSIEATLALIPLFILIATITNINIDYTNTRQEIVLYHQAQDTLDLMSNNGSDSVLDQVSYAISNKQLDNAKKIADPYLKKTLSNRKYKLVEMKQLHGDEICSNADFDNIDNVAVALKYRKNCYYKLFISN